MGVRWKELDAECKVFGDAHGAIREEGERNAGARGRLAQLKAEFEVLRGAFVALETQEAFLAGVAEDACGLGVRAEDAEAEVEALEALAREQRERSEQVAEGNAAKQARVGTLIGQIGERYGEMLEAKAALDAEVEALEAAEAGARAEEEEAMRALEAARADAARLRERVQAEKAAAAARADEASRAARERADEEKAEAARGGGGERADDGYQTVAWFEANVAMVEKLGGLRVLGFPSARSVKLALETYAGEDARTPLVHELTLEFDAGMEALEGAQLEPAGVVELADLVAYAAEGSRREDSELEGLGWALSFLVSEVRARIAVAAQRKAQVDALAMRYTVDLPSAHEVVVDLPDGTRLRLSMDREFPLKGTRVRLDRAEPLRAGLTPQQCVDLVHRVNHATPTEFNADMAAGRVDLAKFVSHVRGQMTAIQFAT